MESNPPIERLSPDFIARLRSAEEQYSLPPRLRELAAQFVTEVLSLLFPHFDRESQTARTVEEHLAVIEGLFDAAVEPLLKSSKGCEDTKTHFWAAIPELYSRLMEDANALFNTDPASESVEEVILAYPGFFALATHRLANIFYRCQVPIWPRLLSEYAHGKTGIDIHPGAKIGQRLAIDHGTGIVIGETTVIGDDVRLYQGVTLGALAVEKKLEGAKRHPTLGHRVVVYAGATILGGDTFIGDDSVIGGNVWLTRSVTPGSTVSISGQKVLVNRPGREPEIEFHI